MVLLVVELVSVLRLLFAVVTVAVVATVVGVAAVAPRKWMQGRPRETGGLLGFDVGGL